MPTATNELSYGSTAKIIQNGTRAPLHAASKWYASVPMFARYDEAWDVSQNGIASYGHHLLIDSNVITGDRGLQ